MYTARVNANQYSVGASGSHTSAWATSPAVTIMDVPQLSQVSYDAGFTTAQWTASTVPGAGYDIQLQPTQGGGLSFQATVDGPAPGGPAPTSARISMAGQSRDRNYTAQVRAHSPTSAGAWSSPVAFTALDPPTGLTVGLVTNSSGVTHTTASWTAGLGTAESFDSYRVLITAPDGSTVYDGTTGGPTTFLDLDDLAQTAGTLHPGVEYTLSLYAVSLSALSALSAPATARFLLPVPPTAPVPPPLPPGP